MMEIMTSKFPRMAIAVNKDIKKRRNLAKGELLTTLPSDISCLIEFSW